MFPTFCTPFANISSLIKPFSSSTSTVSNQEIHSCRKKPSVSVLIASPTVVGAQAVPRDIGVLSRRRLPTTSKVFNEGGRWIMASKHIDCTWGKEELGDVSKLIKRCVAIDGFLDTMGGISSDVTTGGFASLDSRGLRI